MGSPAADLRSALPGLRRMLAMLREHLRPERTLLVGGLVAMLAEVGFRLVEPWPLKVVIDAVVARNAAQQPHVIRLLVLASLAIVAATALRALSSYVMTICLALAGSRAMSRVRAAVYDHLLSLSMGYHGRSRTGDLVTRLVSDVGRLQDVAVTAGLPLVGNVMTLVAMAVVMLFLDPLLGLIVLASLPLFVVTSSRQGRKITTAARAQRRREGDLAGTAAESLGAIAVVHAYGLERVLRGRFASSNQRSLKDGVKGTRLSAGLERRTDLIVGVATAAVVYAGSVRVLGGQLTAGELVVFLSYLKGALRPMRDLAKYTSRIAKAAASGERILDVLAQEPDILDRPGAQPVPRLTGDLRLENVTAAYGGGRKVRTALRHVDLHLPAGTRLGVVGPSGSGKSTLASLVLRLQDPVSGRVLLDGHDLRDVTVDSVRAQVAIVLQESVLFAATVGENIRFGAHDTSDTDTSDAAVVRAARLANAHDFVVDLPDGYDTELGERGASLSGGQRQRIAIARAILRDAPVVILDEATTGLDPVNEREVLDALATLCAGRTTIVISHDVDAVLDCDLVAWLDRGRIVELGAPGALMGQRGSRLATLRAVGSSKATKPVRRAGTG